VFADVYHVQTMYNIKQAAARAGVTVPVLRAWERRYGIVHPARSTGGYRQFDDESVGRIRAMRALVDDGWSPSAAAAAILAGGSVPPAEATMGRGATDPSHSEAPALARRFVDAARGLDSDAIASVLDDLFSRGSFEHVASTLLFPALERLGDAWAGGVVSVAGEHLASNAVLRRLGLALEAAGRSVRPGPRIVVGLPPGGRHELGALAFAVAARRAGLAVTYLGPDLPADDWVGAARGASAAVIGVVAPRDRAPAAEVARRLRAGDADLVIAYGGRAAPGSADVLRLSPDLASAVTELAGRLPA
jgi:DNA-binding transcriptional MerR regulator/methylmalonyl-CoA mutase cobalamin-binding subunit